MKILIKNCNIIKQDKIIESGSIEITNDRISNIFESNDFTKNINLYDEVIDGSGMYASPGFIDIHTHGSIGFDALDGTFEALKNISNYHIKNGVTSYLATPMTSKQEIILKSLKNVKDYMDSQQANPKLESEILGSYLEGPFFSVEKKGAQPLKDIINPNLDKAKSYLEASKGTLKVISLAPELNGVNEIVKFYKDNNVFVAIGHTNSTYEEAIKTIDSGATIATHLYNGMRQFTHREPGVIGAVLTDDRIYGEVIADMIHIHKAGIELAIRSKGTNKIILISDSIRATGVPDGEYELAGQKITSRNGVVLLENNTLAGSTLNLLQAVRNLNKALVLPLYEIVKMASLNPAKSIGLEKDYGSIEIGKFADILLLDNSLNLKKVFKKGIN